jgi:hemolysin III
MAQQYHKLPEGHYSKGEELINSITHGIGVLLSIAGLVYLIHQAIHFGTTWHLVSFIVYGVSLVVLYLASTLYHGIPVTAWKDGLNMFDRSAIYILIAGTYTPFLLNNLRGPTGWWLFALIWGLTIFGLTISLGLLPQLRKASVILYLAMGWLVVLAGRPLLGALSSTSLVWLLVGGVCYTVGVVFYLWRKLPYNHAIWHLFVMGGSAAHYLSVLGLLGTV